MDRTMQYDFETMLPRQGMDAIAVDGLGHGGAPGAPKPGFDALPMWVADMNFPGCPAVTEHILARAAHPAYGYFSPRREYYDAIIRWQTERNGVTGLEETHVGYENGVLGGVLSALGALAAPGDSVLLHSPTYIGFTGSLRGAGYNIVLSELRRDEQGVWRMDFDDMERRIVENRIHAAILCSPHNPCGRVWEPWELRAAMEVFQRHDVWVVSDEIWSDLLLGCRKHTPAQSVSDWAREHVAALYAPSKTFNLAGLVGSYHIIYGDWLRERQAQTAAKSHYNMMNVLSMHALIGAYSPAGAAWVDELCAVLTGNADLACERLAKVPGITLAKPEGTYMLFLHCEEWCRARGWTLDELLRAGWDVGVAWQDGRPFHDDWGIRMNLALPRAKVAEAFDRLEKHVF